MILSKKKLGFLTFDLLCIGILLLTPKTCFDAVCVLLADLFVLIFIAVQVRNQLADLPMCFLSLTYFLFLLSGVTVSIFSGEAICKYLECDRITSNTACFMAFLGIAILETVYLLLDGPAIHVTVDGSISCDRCANVPTDLQKLAVVSLFLLTWVCKLVMAYEKLTYALSYGYVALYTRSASSLPAIVTYIGALFYFSATLLLACRFGKRSTWLAIALILVTEVPILIAGDRTEAVCTILVLLCYTIFRTKEEPGFLRHRRLAVFLLFASLPAAVFVLQVIQYTRVGLSLPQQSQDQFEAFFRSQGSALRIVANGITLKDELSALAGNQFILGQLQAYLQQNALSRGLFGFEAVSQNTVEMAKSGFSYGSAIAYLLFPDTYLTGVGCGTCFLAELYHDLSWAGVIFGSASIALLLRCLKPMAHRSWLSYALGLNCVRTLLMLPRGAYLRWFTETLSVPNLLLLALLLLLGTVSRRPPTHEVSKS